MTDAENQPATSHAPLRQAAVLTGLGLLVVAPNLQYLATHVDRGDISLATREMPAADYTLFVPLLVISSLVGCFLSRRYRLGGLGSRQQLRKAAGLVVGGGLAMAVLSYLVIGRHIAAAIPGFFPVGLGWALILSLRGALVEETVARFGMMTIFCGLVRRPWLANVLQAVFFTFVSVKALDFLGITSPLLVCASLGLTFGLHLVLGAVYARYGLIAASLMHFMVDLKFVFHACIY